MPDPAPSNMVPKNGISTPERRNLWAAIDLGSNSFHMLLVEVVQGRLKVIERLKEKVQLLGGSRQGMIEQAAFDRGLACIARFKQRLADVPVAKISVMGTFVLRQARNADGFVRQVSAILGAELMVIAGQREAELIYQAVAHGYGARRSDGLQLVIDIGGGSTEFGLGCRGTSNVAHSLALGCVAFKDSYFTTGQSSGYEAAKQVALKELAQPDMAAVVEQASQVEVIGTSGTIESVQTVLRANGWSWDTITADAMNRLETAIAEEQWLVDAGVPGLAPDRVDIFPAGVAILKACFEVLQLEVVRYVDVSLLHGMVLDATGMGGSPPMRHELAEQSITELAQRFAVDLAQAARVEKTALALFSQTQAWWSEPQLYRSWLKWAARLHELGAQVNSRHYHRHGAYILKHAELPGLDEEERNILSLLVRGHRRTLPGLAFQAFDPGLASTLTRLVAVLRLAVILERSHSDADSPQFTATLDGNHLHLTCHDGWLAGHPLSARELEVEATQLGSAAINLTVTD